MDEVERFGHRKSSQELGRKSVQSPIVGDVDAAIVAFVVGAKTEGDSPKGKRAEKATNRNDVAQQMRARQIREDLLPQLLRKKSPEVVGRRHD